MIGALCIIASIAGTYFVRINPKTKSIMGALYRGLIASAVFLVLLLVVLLAQIGRSIKKSCSGCWRFITGMNLLWCVFVGLGVTGLLIWITEFYTSTEFRPVRSIAKSSETGHGTNVIQGLAVSMEATALPVIVICGGIFLAYSDQPVCLVSRLRQRRCCRSLA
jgi:K(+)-stimulated pyrophosphate-energized sodium pump